MTDHETTDHQILVLHADPSGYRERLAREFPAIPARFCQRADDLPAILDGFAPTIVFSLRTAAFPGEAHRAALAACPTVRWLQIGGSGYDHLEPIDRARIRLSTAAGALAPFLAETCLLAIAALNFGLHRHVARKRRGLWSKTTFRPLAGQRLLLIGVGAVSRAVGRLARDRGLVVTAVARRPERAVPEAYDRVVPMAALLDEIEEADFVSPHVPLTGETRGMIGAEALGRMKASAHVLNTARGGIVDEAALIDALVERRIAGAYLDVFETEPLPLDHAFWALDSVLMTPHCSDMVVDWETRLADFFIENLRLYVEDGSLKNEVGPPTQR